MPASGRAGVAVAPASGRGPGPRRTDGLQTGSLSIRPGASNSVVGRPGTVRTETRSRQPPAEAAPGRPDVHDRAVGATRRGHRPRSLVVRSPMQVRRARLASAGQPRRAPGAATSVFPPGLGMESFELREDLQHHLVCTAADGREGHVPQEPSGPGFLHVTYPAVELQTGGRYVARYPTYRELRDRRIAGGVLTAHERVGAGVVVVLDHARRRVHVDGLE